MNYADLSYFTRGYVDAIFFTECHRDNPELEEKGFSDFAPETLTRIIEDCAGFEMMHKPLLDAAYALPTSAGCGRLNEPYTVYQAGVDFWLTRNGHGAGFWDRGLDDIGKALSDACGCGTKWPPMDLYLGDDGSLYLS